MSRQSTYGTFIKNSMEEKDYNKNGLPWHIVEKAIASEHAWIKKVLDFGHGFKERETASNEIGIEDFQMLRQLSIDIVKGNIKAKEITSTAPNGLWQDNEQESKTYPERHGGEWHRDMMGRIKEHFINKGFEVVNEPFLNFGRADLGVYKKGYQNLYVEVGTTSLFKLWRNLSSMPDSIFIFVPSELGAIQLITRNVNDKTT